MNITFIAVHDLGEGKRLKYPLFFFVGSDGPGKYYAWCPKLNIRVHSTSFRKAVGKLKREVLFYCTKSSLHGAGLSVPGE